MSRTTVVACVLAIVACKSSTPEAQQPIAEAGGSTDAGVAVVADIASDASPEDAGADEGGTASAAATENATPLPPLAKGAAWSVVRWGMSPADVDAAFAKAGVKCETKSDVKTGAPRTTVKSGAWSAVVYYAKGKVDSIQVTGSPLSKDAAAAAAAKVQERVGAATQTTERLEVRWRANRETSTIVVANDGTVREEYVIEKGAVGACPFARLKWNMSPAQVQQSLTADGYVATITKNAGGLDPCALPNPPPDCAKKKGPPEFVTIVKGDQEGRASFDEFGLSQVEVSGPSTDKGAKRLAQLEKQLGKPASRTHTTKATHADDVAKIELEMDERQPEGTFVVHTTYRPKK